MKLTVLFFMGCLSLLSRNTFAGCANTETACKHNADTNAKNRRQSMIRTLDQKKRSLNSQKSAKTEALKSLKKRKEKIEEFESMMGKLLKLSSDRLVEMGSSYNEEVERIKQIILENSERDKSLEDSVKEYVSSRDKSKVSHLFDISSEERDFNLEELFREKKDSSVSDEIQKELSSFLVLFMDAKSSYNEEIKSLKYQIEEVQGQINNLTKSIESNDRFKNSELACYERIFKKIKENCEKVRFFNQNLTPRQAMERL